MKQQGETVVAICCYGLFDPGFDFEDYQHKREQTKLKVRSKIEMEGLVQYLSHCADLITGLQSEGKLRGVVLCGGYTNKAMSHVSEAETNLQALKQFLKWRRMPVDEINFCLEDESFNTPQNLWFTIKRILGIRTKLYGRDLPRISGREAGRRCQIDLAWQQLKDCPVMFVCDSYRNFKLRVLTSILESENRNFQISVKSFPRKDIHRMSSYPRQWLAGLWYLLSPSKLKEDLGVGQ